MAERNEKEGRAIASDNRKIKTPTKISSATSSTVHRLGILQLGWYAHEEAMPAKILHRIEAGEAIKVPGIVPVLAHLCEEDSSVKKAYLCHPSVQYITKFKGEGSLCGYRNIQMLISYIVESKAQGCELFSSGAPSILQLQDLIEDAWDRNINAEGRLETGGIRGTRKHIGTPEAQALFKGLDIPCSVRCFRSRDGGQNALDQLLAFVKTYFTTSNGTSTETKVHRTDFSPIYLQRPRHSLTIVGFEERRDGSSNLLVLDPGLRPAQQMIGAVKALKDEKGLDTNISLRPHRRGKWQLRWYKEFETLILAASS
jgi:zinc finger-containing ubiquitin peptidase 1